MVDNVGLNGVLVTEDQSSRTFTLRAEDWAWPLDQPIYVVAEVESNNTLATAQAVTRPVTVAGMMGSTTDTDFYRVSVASGQTLTATLTPNASSDYDLYIYNNPDPQCNPSDCSVTNGRQGAAFQSAGSSNPEVATVTPQDPVTDIGANR